jgi:cell division protease FtsH
VSTFYQVLVARYEEINRKLFSRGIETLPLKPSNAEVVDAAYFDSADIDLEDLEKGRVILMQTGLPLATGELRSSLINIVNDVEVDVFMASLGKDRETLTQILKAKAGVIVITDNVENVDPRIREVATTYVATGVDRRVLYRICKQLWPRDYHKDLNHGAELIDGVPASLEDIHVAARGAVSSATFFARLYSLSTKKPEVEPPPPAKQALTKLSDMSGFGPARAWGLQLARDVEAYRAGDIDWSEVDSGLLLSSPPGGGKTMFASALAAECECEFIATQYSEWEGADSRITRGMEKLFESVRKKAQDNVVIFFIDEIDSMGSRGDNGHNESWWTAIINTWLAFLDGAKDRHQVIVIAATNLPDRVDPAMRRPGRLDRHIVIPLPDIGEISGILLHHLKLECDPYPEYLKTAATALRGRSPAEIMQVARDARRHARDQNRSVRIHDVLDVLPPPLLRGQDDWIVCVHEAGHVIGNLHGGFVIENVDADRCVTNSLFPPCVRVRPLMDMIRMTLAGRAAEEVVVGEIGVGSKGDLAHATANVRDHLFQGGGAGLVSRDKGQLFPAEIAIVEAALQSLYAESVALVTRRRQQVVLIARALQERRYLDGSEVDEVLAKARKAFFEDVHDRLDAADMAWGEVMMLDPRQAA